MLGYNFFRFTGVIVKKYGQGSCVEPLILSMGRDIGTEFFHQSRNFCLPA